MTATLIGSLTLGDACPGLQDSVNSVGGALTTLKGIVDENIGLIDAAQSAINSAAGDLDDAKDSLYLGPLADLQARVDSAQLGLNELLAITDAPGWMAGILSQIDAARAVLAGLSPTDYLDDSIAGANAAVDGSQAKLDSMAGDLTDLTDVSDAVRDQTAALGAISRALSDASNATIGAIVDYTEQVSEFLNSGVFVVHYSGALSSLGAEVDAALPDTGINPSTLVTGPLLICETANTPTLGALTKAFGL